MWSITTTIATTAAAVVAGYLLGTGGHLWKVEKTKRGKREELGDGLSDEMSEESEDDGYEDDDDDSADDRDFELRDGDEDFEEEMKMVMVVRSDLGMGKGKIAAQCCHACLGAVMNARKTRGVQYFRRYFHSSQPKIVVKVNTEDELNALFGTAKEIGIPCYRVVDAGRTQIASGTPTAIAVGPAPASLVDVVTRHLRLL